MNILDSISTLQTPPTLLHLDKSILLWVLIPITIGMILSGLITSYCNQSTKLTSPITSKHLIKHESVLSLCRKFRHHYLLLTPHGFITYQNHLLTSVEFGVHETAGKVRENLYIGSTDTNSDRSDHNNNSNDDDDNNYTNKSPQQTTKTVAFNQITVDTPVSEIEEDDDVIDPSNLINGMLGSIFSIIPNMLQFAWISYFFTGFIVAKFPLQDNGTFGSNLPSNFKAMFHHSIPSAITTILPTSYISGISWYILNLLGLSALKSLILEFLSTGSHTRFKQQSNINDDDDDIMYQQTIGVSLPKQDAFGQLNPLAAGSGAGTNGQFEAEYKAQATEIKNLQYQSDTFVYSQNYLLQQWRQQRNLQPSTAK